MENASKALMIAGEILIAILIITLLIYGYENMNQLAEQEDKKEQTQQLEAFNKQYESYNKTLLRGVEVISVINKAIDNNLKYENADYYKVTIEFSIKEAMVYENGKNTIEFEKDKKYNMDSFDVVKNNSDAFTDFKRRIFDCKEVKYSQTSGRINYMYFEEREV